MSGIPLRGGLLLHGSILIAAMVLVIVLLPVATGPGPSAPPSVALSVPSRHSASGSPSAGPLVALATNYSGTPSVKDLSSLLPSVPGGSWSRVSRILPLGGGSFEVLGADSATMIPKLGILTTATTPATFTDTTSGFTAQLNNVSAASLTGNTYDGGQLTGAPTTMYLWNAQFGQFSVFPEIWTVNTATKAVTSMTIPPSFTALDGATSDGAFLLFVGQNFSGATPENLFSVYNASAGYVNVTGDIPASFGAAQFAVGTSSGFLLTSNQSSNTLGLLSYSTGVWKFTNLTASLPPTSTFTSPADPLATNGPEILLGSFPHGLPTGTPDAWGVLNLTTSTFANDTAPVVAALGTPTAATRNPVNGVNFTLASASEVANLDGATGTVSKLAASAPWNSSETPTSLEWTASRTLLAGGQSTGGWAFLDSWAGSGGVTPLTLPSGLVDPSTMAYGNGELWLGGSNGSAGSGLLINLTSSAIVPLGSAFPVHMSTLSASTMLGSTLYLSDGSTILSYNTATSGPFSVLPTVPGSGYTDTLAVVNGTLWAGGTLFTGAAGLFQYSASGGTWTNLSGNLGSMGFGLGDIVPGNSTSALLGGISGNGTGDIWYFSASSAKPFQNVTSDMGATPPTLAGSEQAGWNGTAFWLLDGSQILSWAPSQTSAAFVFFTSPVPLLSLNSLAVAPQGFVLGGYGNESVSAPNVPVALVGGGNTGRLDDLTSLLGKNWTLPPLSYIAGNEMAITSENLSGEATLAALPPLLQGTLYANASEADAPSTIHFSLQVSGGVPSYGTVQWVISGKPSLSGPSANFVFNTSGIYQVNASVSDSGGASLLVQGIVTVNPPLSLQLQATPTSGLAPLTVSVKWNLTGGAGVGLGVDLSFGDTAVNNGLGANGTVSHTYATAGVYTLTATGTDGVLTLTQTQTITVSSSTPPLPTLTGAAISPATIQVKTSATQAFSGTPQCSSSCPVVNYSWGMSGHFGTLNSTRGSSVAFTAGTVSGNFTLYLNVSLNGTVKAATAHVQVVASTTTPPPGGSSSNSGIPLTDVVVLVVVFLVVIVGLLVLMMRRRQQASPAAPAPAASPPPAMAAAPGFPAGPAAPPSPPAPKKKRGWV